MPLPDGYRTAVLSVAHVFDECEAGDTVKLRQNGSTIFGKLISKDPKTVPSDDDYRNDVALIYLRKEIPALDPAPPAQIGDWALILGNQWDRINYATMGIISAVNNDEYETDAAANEGNSGGPLLDSKARVLGLVSYAPLQEDVNSDDPAHNFKTASGIVAAKRLVVTCANLFLDSTSCPFRY
jgi:S1-C subfamily serine protease